MLQKSEEAKRTVISKIATDAKRKTRAARKLDIGDFVEAFYGNSAPGDILSAQPSDLLAIARSVWTLLQKRAPKETVIRAFRPDTKTDGWNGTHTSIQVITEDMPFLVDSVAAELNRLAFNISLTVHPVIKVRRGKNGQLLEITPSDINAPGCASESVMHIEIEEQAEASVLAEIEEGLETVLQDVRAAVEDWQVMRLKIAEVTSELQPGAQPLKPMEIEETKSFLRWIVDNHFTFLGYREYDFVGTGKKCTLKIVPRSGLGILRSAKKSLFEGLLENALLPPDIADFLRRPAALMVAKANERSTVHRAVHLDTISVKKFNRRGEVVGERLFAGLFTSDVYNQTINDIPLLRGKVETIVAASGFQPTSHNGKALMNILETLPRDELLQVETDDLLRTSMGILHLQERQRVALFVHRDPFGRHASCLIYVPRDRFDTALRRKLSKVLEAGFDGKVTASYTQVGDSPLARLHLIVKTTPGLAPPLNDVEIEENLAAATRDWRDDLHLSLISAHGEERGQKLYSKYADAFRSGYREGFSTDIAVSDIDRIEQALTSDDVVLNLCHGADAEDGALRFKIYHRHEPLSLSDVLPVLENMGLRVHDEIPHRVTVAGAKKSVWIHDFGIVPEQGKVIDLEIVKELFEDAFHRVWSGDVEDDGFNSLVLSASLPWRKIVLLRAYCKYLRQAAIPFSQDYMQETLARHPAITRNIVDLFDVLLDPARKDTGDNPADLVGSITDALDAVQSLDEDRILRRYVNAVRSTLRTNFYQKDAAGNAKSYVSLKINSTEIDELPLPRPAVEVFVHSPRVDAVHLRGGKVARGGIRWSDRKEDFRTEILGLMKSQMTKNAVIVPVGSKGGFVVKRPPVEGGREALMSEGIECYKTFMRGLLDITDNIKDGKIIPPVDVVRRDGDDPYLVVAADKGTATFSDIANGVSQDYGFWLDDAFASGGSDGYDHKAMGITARGAWESVKRHFREMGIDVMAEPFTCVGVGDMSGDVFGNGLIYSKQTKLIGAFNHLHIFVDPDPDPAKSFKERKRLFAKPRSGWADYDTSLISKGGGVFERSAKSIKVTPQMRAAFSLGGGDSITPMDLIHAMLKAPADLLWFGGIGTYIKSRDENNIEVGDRGNDALRINGTEVGARVIGEGANLGVTQRGRIEYALAGGRVNTDFIDNSAGVDCSDHEVNIKILLGAAIDAGKLTLKQRNKVQIDMTDDVAALVLMDNYRQSMALTNAQHQSLALVGEHLRFMRALEKSGDLDREVEFLPSDEDLELRHANGAGLSRPELSVLLAYAKIVLFRDVLDSDLPDDPYLTNTLELYFPKLIQKRFGKFIPEHRLRRDIIATYVTNTVINRTGPSFINTLQEQTGAAPAEIVRAYLACRQVFRIAELWSGVEALDNSIPAEVQTDMHLEILSLISRGTRWFLRHAPRQQTIDGVVDAYLPAIERLRSCLEDILPPSLKDTRDQKVVDYRQRKAPEALAGRIANLDALAPACDIVRIAAGSPFAPEEVAKVFYGLGPRFGFDRLRATAHHLMEGSEWRKAAASGIIDDLFATQTHLTTRILDVAGGAAAAPAIVDAWAESNAHAVERVTNMINEINAAPAADLAMLSVVNRELNALVKG
jgi:glutamate dehydrogenase